MSENVEIDPKDTFANFGRGYQEKVMQAMISDSLFADQMLDVLNPKFFDVSYLQEIAGKFFDHKRKYKTFPSADVLELMVTKDQALEQQVSLQVKEYLKRAIAIPLNGDRGYIQESSLDFCKKQTMKDALIKAIDKMEEMKFDDIAPIIKDALVAGAPRDLGHDYAAGFAQRATRSDAKRISSGWTPLDNVLNGGWERGTITTFIAPTGAGKSHFLVNAAASAIEQGLNAVYITLEMADYKIGLRFDSYYSGIELNHVQEHAVKVEEVAKSKAKGRLFIKEFPTKAATVQTIRSYLQRLQAIHNFVPDIVCVDYADLLRGARGYADKRFELEGNYEELRALAQEFRLCVLTADQTNRSGLEMEVVTIGQIGESYAKATVCDLIMTVSRTMEDKQSNTGRLFVAKSRLGRDGMIFPFIMNPATVKVSLLAEGSMSEMSEEEAARQKERLGDKFQKFMNKREK
jgi:archaellum biogenesis ATPase FlaH